mmetsp:Transcript_5428/g.12466  ORF Transcript_5428/g.12466 Transcript_5428/m.12466 type:complete len:240 (+) Transcript_5428:144-863(+)
MPTLFRYAHRVRFVFGVARRNDAGLEILQNNGNVIHHLTTFFVDPSIPRLFGQFRSSIHGLRRSELADEFDSLHRGHELPNSVTAEEQQLVFRRRLELSYLGFASHSAFLVTHEVSKTSGHVEPRISAIPPCINSVVRITIVHHLSASLFYSSSLVLEIRLVLTGQLNSFPSATLLFLAQYCHTISNMGNSHNILLVIMQCHGGSSTRQPRSELFRAVRQVDQILHLLKAILHEMRKKL